MYVPKEFLSYQLLHGHASPQGGRLILSVPLTSSLQCFSLYVNQSRGWCWYSALHSAFMPPMATFRLLRFPQRGRQRSSMNGQGHKLHPVDKSTHIEHLYSETSRSLHPSIEGLTGLNYIFCLGGLKPHYHSEAVSLRQLLVECTVQVQGKGASDCPGLAHQSTGGHFHSSKTLVFHCLSFVHKNIFLVHFKTCHFSHRSWLFNWSQNHEPTLLKPRLRKKSTLIDIWSQKRSFFSSTYQHCLHPLYFSRLYTYNQLYLQSSNVVGKNNNRIIYLLYKLYNLLYYLYICTYRGKSVGKESTCNAGYCLQSKRPGFDP